MLGNEQLQKLQAEYDDLDSKIRRTDGEVKKNASAADVQRHAELGKQIGELSSVAAPTSIDLVPPAAKTTHLSDPPLPTQPVPVNQPASLNAIDHLVDARQLIREDPTLFSDDNLPRTQLVIASIDQAIAAIRNTHRAMGLYQ